MDLLKLLSANEIVAQVLGFLVLLFLLRIFAWGKILGLLDQRKERIACEFKKIEDAKLEIERLRSEYALKMGAFEEAAGFKIKEAIEEAKKITEDSRKKANEEAQAIINHAKEDIKYELAKSKEELKVQIIDLTVKATENLIREKMTGQQDERLVKDFLDNLDKV
jgi:F-type H+-transporting ATPase subunit b